MSIPADAIRVASRQGGHISRAQLQEAGLSLSAIDRRVASAELVMVADGVYRIFDPNGHEDVIRGAVLALPGAVASHQSAAHLLELPKTVRLDPTVTVVSNTTHKFPGVRVRRADDLQSHHVVEVHEIPVTSMARTSFDLAGILPYGEFDSVVEAAIIAGRLSVRQFEAITAELARSGKRGSRAAKDFLAARSGSNARSTVLERRGRAVLTQGGLPKPKAEFSIPWSPRKRFDDAYPDRSTAIEWDSRGWHEQRAAMRADRARDREAALHGWVVLRFTWEDVTKSPDEVIRTVRRLLEERRP